MGKMFVFRQENGGFTQVESRIIGRVHKKANIVGFVYYWAFYLRCQ